jgi:hypothetical protein
MVEAELKRARDNYLFACGLALVAAVTGIAVPGTSDGEEARLRIELLLVGLAALSIFVWVLARARRADAAAIPRPTSSASRMRKMSVLWLALAIGLGVSVMREPLAALIDGTASELTALRWVGLPAGSAIVAVAVWRLAAALLRRKSHD